ncbi:unnamed protein product [Durusdinium trenchii]|uniref:5'-cyclic phosphodiesterase 8A n=2 Tax=Durusdinium trenchii TaxID=1381693 RepID=A0ABP0S760_9DINO
MAMRRRSPRIAALLALLGVQVTCFLQGLRQTRPRQAAHDAQLVTFDFDAFSVPEEQQQGMISSLARQMGVAEKLQVSHESVDEYLEQCLNAMPSNPYHGPAHIMDVMQFLHTLLRETGLDKQLSPVQTSALVLAAAAHDVDHTGTSNALLVSLSHEFVEDVEEGVGPMESHSGKRAVVLIQELLKCRDPVLLQSVQKAIHGTDLSQHDKISKFFSAAIEAPSLDAFFQPGTDESTALLQMLLKASDVSNPARPMRTAQAWNSQVYQEFYAEGDQVLSAGGMPNPLHDRRTNCIPKSSVGFINFHVKTIFLNLRNFLLRCHELGMPVRPEGAEAVLARLDENAAAFAQEAAKEEANVESVQA